MIQRFWIFAFGDKSDENLVKVLRDHPCIEDKLDLIFTDSPTRSQKHWKKPACKSSGPGVLNGLSTHRLAEISTSETCLSKFMASASFR